jgi:hypothetical protein
MHWRRVRMTGSPNGRIRPVGVPFEERFWARVEKTDACWLWTGGKSHDGYGSLNRTNGPKVRAHRASYEMFVGPIPEEMTVDHICFNTLCVNPEHLQLLSSADNARRQRLRLLGLCSNGHKMTPENTYVRPGTDVRRCKTCVRDRGREYRARQKARAC